MLDKNTDFLVPAYGAVGDHSQIDHSVSAASVHPGGNHPLIGAGVNENSRSHFALEQV